MSDITARSILSHALVGANPYDEAQRILDHLDRAGWTIERKPRIPQPEGFAPVVEAGVSEHDERLRWYRNNLGTWSVDDNREYARKWDQLIDPTLVRPGIEESS